MADGKADFIKKTLEQSFVVICLIVGLYFIFLEYKTMFEKYNDKSERDEEIMLKRLHELNEKNDALYERLIKCNE